MIYTEIFRRGKGKLSITFSQFSHQDSSRTKLFFPNKALYYKFILLQFVNKIRSNLIQILVWELSTKRCTASVRVCLTRKVEKEKNVYVLRKYVQNIIRADVAVTMSAK